MSDAHSTQAPAEAQSAAPDGLTPVLPQAGAAVATDGGPALRLQIHSDLHLESEAFDPVPAPGADALVLAGDIDTTWVGLARFAGWPVPVWLVPGNHEFEDRDLRADLPRLRDEAARHGIELLYRDALLFRRPDGGRTRVLGTTLWPSLSLFGPEPDARTLRAVAWFLKCVPSTVDGEPMDIDVLQREARDCRAWLSSALRQQSPHSAQAPSADGAWDSTLVITHFAPSARCADPRYGLQPGTAYFCSADDALLPGADWWIHGHLHSRHDLWLTPDAVADAAAAVVGTQRPDATRVICAARGLEHKGEVEALPQFEPVWHLQPRRG